MGGYVDGVTGGVWGLGVGWDGMGVQQPSTAGLLVLITLHLRGTCRGQKMEWYRYTVMATSQASYKIADSEFESEDTIFAG